jgi:hypothetical protein
MRHIAFLILFAASTVFAAPIENVTSSALLPGDSAIFNLDFIDPFGIPLYDVILKAKSSGNQYSDTMSHIEGDLHYATTFQGAIPFSDPSGMIEFYGRIEGDTLVATQSFKNASNQFPPEVNLYADLAPDAVGDTTPGSLGQWLDLTGSAVTYSDTRFYARLNNVGGGWPLNQGFTTYFIYGFVLANPDSLALSGLALIYANVPLFLSTGLYSVNLADTSFSRIANISSQTSGNSLHLACNISDIISDPLFPTWPPQSGHIITGGFALTAELGTPGFNDFTYPSSFAPVTQLLNADINAAPGLGESSFGIIPDITVDIGIDYFDSDNNLPILRQLFFDGEEFAMGSFDHNYADTARFGNLLAWPGSGLHTYYFLFSDGNDTVQTPIDTLDLSPTSARDDRLPQNFELTQNYPNPFNAQTTISFSLAEAAYVEMQVYDISGKEIRTLYAGFAETGASTVIWDGTNSDGLDVSSGIYFYRISAGGDLHVNRSMILLR